MDKIIDNLFLGNVMDAQTALSNGSMAVLSIGAEFTDNEEGVTIPLDNSSVVNHKILKLWDGNQGTIDYSFLVEVFEFIDTNKPVLVHCMAGHSRSPSVVWAYLLYLDYDPVDAYVLLKQKRPEIYPYIGFLEEILMAFDYSEPDIDDILTKIMKIQKVYKGCQNEKES